MSGGTVTRKIAPLVALVSGCASVIGADFDRPGLPDAERSELAPDPGASAAPDAGCPSGRIACAARCCPIAKRIAAGIFHTCLVTTEGAVACWGRNVSGQVTGTSNDVLAPAFVPDLRDVAALDLGTEHSCALTAVGTVRCWGDNAAGQLGDGTTTKNPVGVTVARVTSATEIAAASLHTCAVASGAVSCWGSNDWGRLGDGTTTSSATAVAVHGLGAGSAKRVTNGRYHSCAVTAAGGVRCWGNNTYGQLGDGSMTNSNLPQDAVAVVGAIDVKAAAAHTCALTKTDVLCWGSNDAGNLGNGTTDDKPTPIAVPGLGPRVRAIAVSVLDTCAVTEGGAVLCWGDNRFGQLGDGSTTNRPLPTPVKGIERGAVDVVAGETHTCALMDTGAVKCWGGNASGQLGTGSRVASPVPVDVVPF